jgi:hypothetical protein
MITGRPGCVTFLQPEALFDIVRACSLVVRLGGVVTRHPPPASGQMGEDELALKQMQTFSPLLSAAGFLF